jgi:hypothetical protein
MSNHQTVGNITVGNTCDHSIIEIPVSQSTSYRIFYTIRAFFAGLFLLSMSILMIQFFLNSLDKWMFSL